MGSEIDYTKLSVKELKQLMLNDDHKADLEYDRRVKAGEIKLRRVTMEEIIESYRKSKAS